MEEWGDGNSEIVGGAGAAWRRRKWRGGSSGELIEREAERLEKIEQDGEIGEGGNQGDKL